MPNKRARGAKRAEPTFAGLKALIPHERTWKGDEYADHPEQCPACYAERLEKRVEELRDRVDSGIISGELRDPKSIAYSGDYDSGVCDAEIAFEQALTAILGGRGAGGETKD